MKLNPLSALLVLALASGSAWADEDISKVNGRITAEAGRQYGSLETVNGGISIQDNATTGDAETVNGGITVGNNARTGGLSTVNGQISVGQKGVISGGIETVNGSVFVDQGGRIGGGIETVNGAIGLVHTEVAQSLETVNGDITVGVGSHVRGGITVERNHGWFQGSSSRRKPRVVIGPEAIVDGPMEFRREVALYVHKSARIGQVTGAEPVRFETETAPQD